MAADSALIDPRALAGASVENALAGAHAAARRGEAGEAALELEKLFATLLLKEMRRGLSEGFFGDGAGADVYEGWLDEHMGAALAEGPGLGLRIALERDLGPAPAAAPAATAPATPRNEEVRP